MDKRTQERCFITNVIKPSGDLQGNLLTLKGEHDFKEDEIVITIAEKDFNQMQKLLEHRRKSINSFEVTLEELKTEQNIINRQQEETIRKLDDECLKLREKVENLSYHLDELYSLYDGLDLKYGELEKSFNLDEPLLRKLEEVKQILKNIYNLKEHHPLGYLKGCIPKSISHSRTSNEGNYPTP